MHLVGEPVHLPAGVAEYHSLSDGEGFIKITESLQLPVFLLDVHEKLLNT